jgi:hypothetical protein
MPFRGIFDTVLYNHNNTEQTELAGFATCIAYVNATGVPQLKGVVIVKEEENLFCTS